MPPDLNQDIFFKSETAIQFQQQTGHPLSSSDYLDSLECGVTPEPDSQYWVAPFVQKVFDEVLTRFRPDVANRIKEHSVMQLEQTD